MKTIKAFTSFILALAILFTFSSCALEQAVSKTDSPTVEESNEGQIYYNVDLDQISSKSSSSSTTVSDTAEAYQLTTEDVSEAAANDYSETISARSETTSDETVATTSTTVTNDTTAEAFPTITEPPVETTPAQTVSIESSPMESISTESVPRETVTEALEIIPEATNEESVFTLALDRIAYELYASGYDVYIGYATLPDGVVPGLIFTDDTVCTTDENGNPIYQAGFLQIVNGKQSGETRLTVEIMKEGVFATPADNSGTAYLINLTAEIKAFSGICDGLYFRYRQTSECVVEVEVLQNKRRNYDESIDLFDYDKGDYVYLADLTYTSVSASGFYMDEETARAAAINAIDEILRVQNENTYQGEIVTLVLISEDMLTDGILNQQTGTINGYSLKELGDIKLARNQFLMVSSEGVSVYTYQDRDEAARQRSTNGLINLISGALIVSGAIGVAIFTGGAGAPVLLSSIVYITGAGAVAYGVSNAIQGASDLYYGLKKDVTSVAANPLLDAFKSVIKDEETATKAYHIFGISTTLVQSLCVPANMALKLNANAGFAAKTGAVVRAVAVELTKDVIITGAGLAVSIGTNHLITKYTDAEAWVGDLAGFGTGLMTSILVNAKLNKLDIKYNFSGTHTKKVGFSMKNKYSSKDFGDDLNWDLTLKNGETRTEHIVKRHAPNSTVQNTNKFSSDPIDTVNRAWANRGSTVPVTEGDVGVFYIRSHHCGTKGENYVKIIVLQNTNQIISAYPVFMPETNLFIAEEIEKLLEDCDVIENN